MRRLHSRQRSGVVSQQHLRPRRFDSTVKRVSYVAYQKGGINMSQKCFDESTKPSQCFFDKKIQKYPRNCVCFFFQPFWIPMVKWHTTEIKAWGVFFIISNSLRNHPLYRFEWNRSVTIVKISYLNFLILQKCYIKFLNTNYAIKLNLKRKLKQFIAWQSLAKLLAFPSFSDSLKSAFSHSFLKAALCNLIHF